MDIIENLKVENLKRFFKKEIKEYTPVLKAVLILVIFSISVYAIWRVAGWSFQSKFPWFYLLVALCLLGVCAVAALVIGIMEDIAMGLYDELLGGIKNKTFRLWVIRCIFFFVTVALVRLLQK
ncbi:MAG: hypothetical protein WC852_03830 [Candidatus Nanoarchaeia archaeon]|jgi:hypothetical protein